MELTGQGNVRLLQRPDLDPGAGYQAQRCIEGLQPSDGQVGMGHFLQDLCRGAQRCAASVGFDEEFLGVCPESVGSPTAYMKTLVSTKITSRQPLGHATLP